MGVLYRVQVAFTYEWTTDTIWGTYGEAEERVKEWLESGYETDQVRIVEGAQA